MDEVSFVLGFDGEVLNNDAVGLLIDFTPIELQRSLPQRHTGRVTPLLLCSRRWGERTKPLEPAIRLIRLAGAA